MQRILIIGCSGAGKSTLARKLGEKTGLPVVHLDALFWKPGWVESEREVFDARVLAELEKPAWIIDGNYARTLPVRLEKCDGVIYLDFPRWLCLWGVLKRVAKNYGKIRPDMPEGCPERFDWEFLVWVWNFNKHVRPKLLQALESKPEVTVTVLKNRKDVNRFLAEFPG
jgi:adenylate kinase family enzyme